jgi:hypothetical protein
MKTVSVNLYSFDELSSSSKQFAIDKYRYLFVEFDWSEPTIESFIDKLNNEGFEDATIYYSQGSGASFEADIDLARFIEFRELDLLEAIDIAWAIVRSSTRCHERAKAVVYCGGSYPEELEELIHSITNRIEKARLDFSREIYNTLESEHDYRTSDEFVSESLTEMGEVFLESGKFF